MPDNQLYYRHSGKFASFAPPAIIVGGLACGLIIGVAYGIAVWYSPLIYINFLGTLFLSGAAGYAVAWIARRTHNRSTPLTALGGLLAGVAVVYGSWVGWLYPLSGWVGTLFNPLDIWHAAGAIGEEGVWGIGSSGEPVSGMFLYAIWVVEAGILLCAAPITAATVHSGTPYCETSGQWLDKPTPLGPLEPVTDPAGWQQKL